MAIANQPKLLIDTALDVTLELIQGKRPLHDDSNIVVPPKVLRGDDPDDALKFIKDQYFMDLSK